MILHTLNQSPFTSRSLENCLRVAQVGSSLLLIEDAVWGAMANTPFSDQLQLAMQHMTLYALQPDLDARGVTKTLIAGIQCIDYFGFVDLVVLHDSVIAWS